MKKYFLLFAIIVSFFYLSQNVSAPPCDACDALSGAGCPSPYASGDACYYGMACNAPYVVGYWRCTTGQTNVVIPGKFICDVSGTPYAYVNMDTSDPRADTQCQIKGCANTGWVIAGNQPDGTACTYNGKASTCKTGACQIVQPPTACPDGTLEGACCSTQPGKKCKNDGGTLRCLTDPTCPNCFDTDGGQVSGTKGTCRDTVGGSCTGSGCTDTCASNGAVTEYYCTTGSQPTCMPTTISCSSSDVCSYGACMKSEDLANKCE